MLAVTISKTIPVDATQNDVIVYGSIVLTGSYPTTGDVMDLSKFSQIPSNALPDWVEFEEAPPAGTSPTGYEYIYCPGATLALGQVAIFNGTTEFSAGAYSAGLLAAVIKFRAYFKSFA